MIRLAALNKKDHKLNYLHNSGKGICGSYSYFQAKALYSHQISERTMFTRNGSDEQAILQQISNSMGIIKQRVETSPQLFSKRSHETVANWSHEVKFLVMFKT